ncbi:MAG: RnfABCDGE type electron transport complex subunit D [Lachnospiraceae bacterium]|nr:RnfABCDGE type electron transport complex subunit D [Lachnospiraceae bacterium]
MSLITKMNLHGAVAPHIHARDSVGDIMRELVFSLIPILIFSSLFFGWHILLPVGVSVASCVLFELIWQKMKGQKTTVTDCSAIVTGLLLSLCLPSSVPLWMPVIGAFVAIILCKQLFGGIGKNLLNPALTGACFLTLVFSRRMSALMVDTVSVATPLASVQAGMYHLVPQYASCFLGIIPGSIGETSKLLILLGGLYLWFRGIIDLRIPVTYILTVFLLSCILGSNGLYQILTGGLFLGAFFMATDYTTTPMRPVGKIIFALGCGILTTLIRLYTSFPEGVSFSILLMNLLTPLVDKLTAARPFGESKYRFYLFTRKKVNKTASIKEASRLRVYNRLINKKAADPTRTGPLTGQIAFVHCAGSHDRAERRFRYEGLTTCRDAVVIPGGSLKECRFACLGLGSCKDVCRFDAIQVKNGVAQVLPEKCVGCGDCIDVCPKHIISMVPTSAKIHLLCQSPMTGDYVKSVCKVGCLGCGTCVETCGEHAIRMADGLPLIDQSRCTGCGACTQKCPVRAITLNQGAAALRQASSGFLEFGSAAINTLYLDTVSDEDTEAEISGVSITNIRLQDIHKGEL